MNIFTRGRLLSLLTWLGATLVASAQTLPRAPLPGNSPPIVRPRAAAPQQQPAYQRPVRSSRVNGDLQRMYSAWNAATKKAKAPVAATLQAAYPQLQLTKDASAVLVRVTARDVEALLPTLQARGFVVTGSAPAYHFVEGLLPVSQLDPGTNGLSSLARQGLMGIMPAYRPFNNAGRLTSQAEHVLEVDRVRATKPGAYDGKGVRIGVMSDSYNSLQGAANDVASGDLPNNVLVLQDLTGASAGQGTDEGRGMMQLIYDLAPGSPLAFSSVYLGEANFATQIRRLADPAVGNCKVLTDDIAYYTEPYFQDGIVAQAVNEVVTQQGVAYFSAAGNNSDQSYENTSPSFVAVDATGDALLNFNPSGIADYTQAYTINQGEDVLLALQWADPFYTTSGVKTDLDILLISAQGDTVAGSGDDNIQNQTPSEIFSFTNDTTQTHTTTFNLVISRYRGTANPTRIKYLNYGTAVPSEYDTKSGTIVGHAAAAQAQAVAAVGYYNQRNVESFSSYGSPTILFTTAGAPLGAPETRPKPDITSIDGANTTSFAPYGIADQDLEGDGYPNFFGTSAAAPHAAAVAALLRQAEPNLTPAQVYSRLQSTARDLSTPGFDNRTGYGLINAYAAIYGPPTVATLPTVQDFEQQALPQVWQINNVLAGRAQVRSDQNPASGKYHLILSAAIGRYFSQAYASLSEAILRTNASNLAGNLLLTFREKEFNNETDNQLPAQFTETSATRTGDGVALSVDGGTTWYRLVDLTGTTSTTTYQTFSVNLTQFAQANNLTLGNDVRIKFQQYGSGRPEASESADQGGIAFDDIALTAVNSPPLPLFSSTQPTTGCPGLSVTFANNSLLNPTSYAWSFPGGTPSTSTAPNPTVTYNTGGRFPVTLAVTNANGTIARTDTGYVVVYGRAPQVAVSTNHASLCPGGQVQFTSTTAYCPDTYAWSFPGGSPATSTAPNPTVTYAAAGTYTATLTVSNGYGSTTVTQAIEVTTGLALPFAETFDNSPTLPTGWSISNPDGTYTWTLVDNVVNRQGTRSRVMQAPFHPYDASGQQDVLQTPSINLSGSARLLFDLAYAPVSAAYPDSLTILVVDACSQAVLGKVYAKGQAQLATTAASTSYFTPTRATAWRQESVELSAYTGRAVQLRFVTRNGFGNNLYLDNIQVNASVLATTNSAGNAGLQAWPNPVRQGEVLTLELPAQRGAATLKLVDAVGREVWHDTVELPNAATQRTVPMPFTAGVYNLLFQPASGGSVVRRILVQ